MSKRLSFRLRPETLEARLCMTGVMGMDDAGASPPEPASLVADISEVVQKVSPGEGIRVATGDVDGEGTPDIITAAGPGGGPHVKVFDGQSADAFFAYSPSFSGGVRVAVGDVNNDGVDDIITAADTAGGPHVRVFDALSVDTVFAFDPQFTGGVFVGS